jgi:hypothetical protein
MLQICSIKEKDSATDYTKETRLAQNFWQNLSDMLRFSGIVQLH